LTINDYYDANGNIQELETLLDINWNYRNQLRVGTTVQRTTAIDDGEYYLYDSAGNRVRKKYRQYVNVYSTRYTEKVYIGNVEIKKIRTYSTFSGYTTNLKRTTLHIMDDTRRIASVHNWSIDGSLSEINSSSELNTNKIRYQYGNHIDSASLELSSTGSIISYEEYFPYGDTSLIAGTAQKEVKLKEYRYTGKEKDDVTGLYYYGARYYASWLGRWMSTDPLFRENPSVYDRPKGKDEEAAYWGKVYGEGLNLYCYVKGNPVTLTDPNGRESDFVTWLHSFGASANRWGTGVTSNIQNSETVRGLHDYGAEMGTSAGVWNKNINGVKSNSFLDKVKKKVVVYDEKYTGGKDYIPLDQNKVDCKSPDTACVFTSDYMSAVLVSGRGDLVDINTVAKLAEGKITTEKMEVKDNTAIARLAGAINVNIENSATYIDDTSHASNKDIVSATADMVDTINKGGVIEARFKNPNSKKIGHMVTINGYFVMNGKLYFKVLDPDDSPDSIRYSYYDPEQKRLFNFKDNVPEYDKNRIVNRYLRATRN